MSNPKHDGRGLVNTHDPKITLAAVTFVDDSFVSDLLRLRCLTLNLLTTWHDGFFILDEGTGSSQRGVLGDTFGEKTTSLMP